MSDKEQLRVQLSKVQSKLAVIEQQEARDRAKTLVGQCFKYRNSYGYGKSWWLYMRVLGYDKCGYLETIEFQRCTDGRIEIKTDRQQYKSIKSDSSYSEIPSSEFVRAWRSLVAGIGKIKLKP